LTGGVASGSFLLKSTIDIMPASRISKMVPGSVDYSLVTWCTTADGETTEYVITQNSGCKKRAKTPAFEWPLTGVNLPLPGRFDSVAICSILSDDCPHTTPVQAASR